MVALVLLLGGCGDDADSDDGSTLETETVRVNVGQGGLSEAADIVVPADAMSLHLVARATGASGKLAFELTQDGALRVSLKVGAKESQPGAEALKVRVAARGTERQPSEDRRGLTVQGVFDVTRFGWSHLGTRPS